MIRTFLVAACTALALASAGVGTASAAEPKTESAPVVNVADLTGQCTVKINEKTCLITTGPLKNQTCAVEVAPVVEAGVLCTKTSTKPSYTPRPGGPRPGGHWDGHNRYIDWDNGSRGDICVGRDYNDWLSRNSAYRGEINRYGLNSNRWLDLRKVNKCSPDVIVTNDGDCVTFRNVNRDNGNRYNSRVRELVDQARDARSDEGRNISRSERARIDNAADLRDFLGKYNTSRDQLRTICKDDSPEVIVTPAPDVIVNPAPTTTIVQAPPSVVSVPQGPAQTGDGSTE